MSEKVRLVNRTSRKDSGSAKHNSRDGDESNRSHIDKEKSQYNYYWTCLKGKCKNESFEEMEKEYYEKRFGSTLKKQNERYIENRQYGRCKTMDQFRKGRNTKPEEEIFQIGGKDNAVDRKMLFEVFKDYFKWHKKEFPEVKFLNIALHVDEEGAPHIHVRRLWEIENNDGTVKISQEEVLRRHNIELPNSNKKEGQYNNRKMTYTKMIREKLLEICLSHGIDIATDVKDSKAKHLHPDEYKAKMKVEEELKSVQTKLEGVMNRLNDKEMQLNAVEITLDVAQRERLHLQSGMEQLRMDLINLHMLMIDNKVPAKLKDEQAQLTYNNCRKLRDRVKKSGLMDDKDKEKLDDINKFARIAIDYIQGYKQGSYLEDPFINEYFLKKHTDDFKLFIDLADEKKKREDEKSAKALKAGLRELEMSLSTNQSSDEDDYSF